jgi:hypothetical protein
VRPDSWEKTFRHNKDRSNPYDHPVFFAFGKYHKFLTIEEASVATPEERISSIWPFIVKQSIIFLGTLHTRELVNFDADDVLLEIWIELRQKDCKWDPAIGSYISFCGKLIHHLFIRLRERSRTVESPRNTNCRIKEYMAIEQEGRRLSQVRAKNQRDIRRTVGGTSHMGMFVPEQEGGEPPDRDFLHEENVHLGDEGLRESLARLSPCEAAVLGRLHGLWGSPVLSVFETARELGKTTRAVRQIYELACAHVRDYLESEFHPAASG